MLKGGESMSYQSTLVIQVRQIEKNTEEKTKLKEYGTYRDFTFYSKFRLC